jgi:ParB-like chromosome segregation protein Spo0J
MSKGIEFRLTEIEEIEKEGIKLYDVQDIDPELLKPNPDNKIFNPLSGKDYELLKEDIRERGIIDPLIIRQDKVLLTGHNRLRIALELKLKTIPVRKIESGLKPKDEKKFLVLDNLLRRQLSPTEKESLIHEFYKDEILEDNRGGDRKSLKKNDGKIKGEISPLIPKESLAKKIQREIGISEDTAKKILAKKRKELLPKKANDSKPGKVTKTDPNKKVIETRLKKIDSELASLEKQKEKLKSEKAELTKHLRKLK